MTPKNRFTQIAAHTLVSALLAIIFCAFTVPEYVYAGSDPAGQPGLSAFIESVRNGDANLLRGVYVANVLAFPVVQQPAEDSRFVSLESAVVTQFDMAAQLGSVGLLAHNNLAGKVFPSVIQGDQIVLIYGDGRTETFVVESILQYQVLAYSQYENLQTHSVLGVGDLFYAVYGGEYHVTLQTCIDLEGDPSWGRLFIIAKPVPQISNQADSDGWW